VNAGLRRQGDVAGVDSFADPSLGAHQVLGSTFWFLKFDLIRFCPMTTAEMYYWNRLLTSILPNTIFPILHIFVMYMCKFSYKFVSRESYQIVSMNKPIFVYFTCILLKVGSKC
jgi:hypothetical protein